MTVIVLFWIFTTVCCGYALTFGDRDGRIAAAMIVAAVMLSWIAQGRQETWTAINLPVMAADLLLWIGQIALMLCSRRYWPIWMAAAQSLTVASHLATLVTSGFTQKSYAGLATVWAIPCLLCMVGGVALDRRALSRSDRR